MIKMTENFYRLFSMIFFEFPKKILGQDINQDYTIFSRDTQTFIQILSALVKYYYPFIVTQSPFLEKTAIKLTYIRQPSSADPILFTITSLVFICYKSYRFSESPAFSMFRELTLKIKLLRQYGKKTWDSILVMVVQLFLVIHKPS